MKNILHFEPLTTNRHNTYLKIEIATYNQNFLDTKTKEEREDYIKHNYTLDNLEQQNLDNTNHVWLINLGQDSIGVLKLKVHNNKVFTNSIEIEKLSFLQKYNTIKNNEKSIKFAELRSKEFKKDVILIKNTQNSTLKALLLKQGFEDILDKNSLFKLSQPNTKFELIKKIS